MRKSLAPASEAEIKRGRGWGISKDGSSTREGVKAVKVGVREQKEGRVTGLRGYKQEINPPSGGGFGCNIFHNYGL